MAITSYSELKTAVDNWFATDAYTARVPEWIALAEGEINRAIYPTSTETRATVATTAGTAYITLPSDVRQLRNVKINNNPVVNLRYMTPDALYDLYPGSGNGLPKVYSIIGQELLLRPTPDDTYTVEIDYLVGVTALSDSNTSNRILARHPDVYLYGALKHGHLYLMDEQRAQIYDGQFRRAMEEVKLEEGRTRYGNSPTMRVRVVA